MFLDSSSSILCLLRSQRYQGFYTDNPSVLSSFSALFWPGRVFAGDGGGMLSSNTSQGCSKSGQIWISEVDMIAKLYPANLG